MVVKVNLENLVNNLREI